MAGTTLRRRYAAGVGIVVVALSGVLYSSAETTPAAGQDYGRPAGLPLPSSVPLAKFEEKLFSFLNDREYVRLGWRPDKGVRDTGPFLDGKSYGTHPAVRVYYSPGVVKWLVGGRVGKIPDGEMIVKEQYPAPAARHRGKSEAVLRASLESWTVMVKDSAGSHDGWFWSNPTAGQCVVDSHQDPFPYPVSGFGQYCVRCHASTRSPGAEASGANNEYTFASLRNIAGFPGEPILFRVDDSWREDARKAKAEPKQDAHPSCARPKAVERPARPADLGFLNFFNSIGSLEPAALRRLPPETHDWAVARRDGSREFVTSNQCMSCHAGLMAPFGPSMYVPAGKTAEYGAAGWDVSPYGEWRWTPMGLAGRDPVFFAQLETEMRLLRDDYRHDPARGRELSETLTDTCLKCHGSMGHREFHREHPGAKFTLDHALAIADPADHPGAGDARYGALARDGVSCAVCHRMQPKPQPACDPRPYLQFFIETATTGDFTVGPKGDLYGPIANDQIAPYAMEHATGRRPKHSPFLKSAQLCGTCHTVTLPNVDRPIAPTDPPDELAALQTVPAYRRFHHHVEQSTYLEWLNSEYENEIDKANPKAKTCQDCHMATGLTDARRGLDRSPLRTRIAAIQDDTYPEAENLAPHADLHVRVREDGSYRRHNFSGLNVFLLELFNQFDDVLGVRKDNFMTGSKEDVSNAIQNFVETARRDTADVRVAAAWPGLNRLTARVAVRNKAGHRFPSGVGFRRAFLELTVYQPARGGQPERVVWASGQTNALGVLIGADGRPLPTEFFDRDAATGSQLYQPHYEVITSPDQVQVYETLLLNAKGEFTTSFVRGCRTVKDNRLLPRGWKPDGPGPGLTGRYLQATHPDAVASADRDYATGSGGDEVTYQIELPRAIDVTDLEVRATLYYQALPPYYLRNLFAAAPDGPATARLHAMASHLDLRASPVRDWKLPVASATTRLKR
ncbi:cytochrome P460 family protein [Limnoglobus roseus]|uniref:Cytochrome P460 domain-containing protein n=1 Tax=Limnoglobus roseus TaxID=2598579 RepID=A0A5C1ARQ9_9BACT|nr:cytochrome P460 family protein [Limnoglobus roseus]QEL20773.1 hypothetical protein PX52LOC_07889 [Limnoglobus roseus]